MILDVTLLLTLKTGHEALLLVQTAHD